MNLDKISSPKEPSRSPSRAAAPKETLGAASPARPLPASVDGHGATDRVEASPDLRNRVPRLQEELRQDPQVDRELRKERVEQIRDELGHAKRNLKETLLRAAHGVLTGELYFQ